MIIAPFPQNDLWLAPRPHAFAGTDVNQLPSIDSEDGIHPVETVLARALTSYLPASGASMEYRRISGLALRRW